MQTNYDWSKFSFDNSWVKELDSTSVSVSDVCLKIIKEISGHKKIKAMKIGCLTHEMGNIDEYASEDTNITLLKRRKFLCFCKWKEYIISETDVEDIENIIFEQVHKDDQNEYVVIYIKEKTGFYWRYEIII